MKSRQNFSSVGTSARQGYLEPHAVVVQVLPSERILIWSTAKQVYLTRGNLAAWLGIDQEKIIFQVGAVGGDFGGKGTLMDLPLCYFLAQVAGRPAKMIMSYAEELGAANPRHASLITIKTGVKKDGRLWTRELKAVFNGGAYAGIKESSNGNLPGSRRQRLVRDSSFVHSVAVRLHQTAFPAASCAVPAIFRSTSPSNRIWITSRASSASIRIGFAVSRSSNPATCWSLASV